MQSPTGSSGQSQNNKTIIGVVVGLVIALVLFFVMKNRTVTETAPATDAPAAMDTMGGEEEAVDPAAADADPSTTGDGETEAEEPTSPPADQ